MPLANYDPREGRDVMERRRNLQKGLRHSTDSIRRAERQLAKSISNDVQQHLITQEQNAMTIA